jgi:glycosyltransferase involved in cell wall biosynthesis
MKKESMNRVIVLIPHYNNIEGLVKSISSIGNEENIDVLIVDDGSIDKIEEDKIYHSFKANGVVFIDYLEVNKGIEHALNRGLKIILEKGYEFTARLDCGDTCVFNRFKTQEVFLETHKEIVLVGSDVNFTDKKGKVLYNLKTPKNDADIKKKMYINAMHIHPTIMFRNEILKTIGLYPVTYKAAEDFAFFFKIIQKYKVANINSNLVNCELNPNGISSVQRKVQAKNRIKIILKYFYFGIYPIYGLIRSIVLYVLPLRLLIFLKRVMK